ncbi:hydantoinase/oxoprolinase family protein [Govanella unica]|uniref:Hydantoinase/oxoprolinase family protein n=1 Tax=Govanella unica TaxID=2975056 RepID=A0A9X3Z6D8_9PROT|nr:hydantoinase/oxoprolinase family protein [Govania unica]MDA5192829.1 hydantoinase/oxoprolinase family protein [Govania unica]
MTDYRLGIDVGGTNTDAVIMRGREVVTATKRATTQSVGDGVVDAVTVTLQQSGLAASAIKAVMIGTTQFVNAFLQRKNLSELAIIRISLPRTDGVPPMVSWPKDLRAILGSNIYMTKGGAYYTGQDYIPLDEEAIAAAALDIKAKGLKAIAISANFAPIRPDLEHRARDIVRGIIPDAMITLSSDVGGIGLIDRENAAIINASLMAFSREVVTSLVQAIKNLNISAPLYISQNDGTLLTTEAAEAYPILTCSAGPTNSIRGAAFLTGLQEAVVVDIGGTTTDIGFLVKGFPRETTGVNYIGGVRTNFRMPDVLSIALGGGSIVREEERGIEVGPQSVGFHIREEALLFGGPTLTTTDVAVKARDLSGIGDPAKVAHLDDDFVSRVMDAIRLRIEDAVDQMKTSSKPVPVVMVGGGSILVTGAVAGASDVLMPPYAEVANAVGAAIAQVSGRVDKLYDYGQDGGRLAVLEIAKQDAIDAAIRAGADPDTVEVLDIAELPMMHMKTNAVQVKVRAVGNLFAMSERAAV